MNIQNIIDTKVVLNSITNQINNFHMSSLRSRMAIFNISNFQRCINRKCDVKFISKTIKIHHYVSFYITARPLIYLSAASPMLKFYVYIIPAEKCSICNVKIIPIRSTLLLIFLDHKIKMWKRWK